MKLTTILAATVLLAASVTSNAQSPVEIRKTRLKDLNFLLGTWQLSSDVKNPKGDGIMRTGTMTWAYDMDSTVIRNDREFNAAKGTGEFASFPHMKFYEYIMFNPARNMFEFISYEYGGAGSPRYWLVDTKDKVIQYRFARFDAAKGLTLETIVTLKYVNENKLIETFEDIAFETGERTYLNTITLTRSPLSKK